MLPALLLTALGSKTVRSGIASGISSLAKKVMGSKAGKVATAAAGVAATAGITRGLSGSSPNLPALPLASGPMAAAGNTALAKTSPGGLPVPFWKGPGGKLQMPWNDPRIPEYLKQFALDDAYLKIYYRAPRGYVIVKDANGKAFAVNKKIAQQFGLWHPAAKPPISATDWKHYRRAKSIEKKLLKISREAHRKHARPASFARVATKKK